jgi:hypothetical protein
MVFITVFFSFTGATVLVAAGFLTTVVVLASLESLIVLALPRPTLGADAGGAARFPRPAPVAVLASVAFRVAAPRVVLVFSTIPVRIPAAPPTGVGATGLRGETGRASWDLTGETAVRTGDRGIEREFADLGERTWEGCSLSREVVRAETTGPRTRFLGFSISSFSLSTEMSSLVMINKIQYLGKMKRTSIVSGRVVVMDWHDFGPPGLNSLPVI